MNTVVKYENILCHHATHYHKWMVWPAYLLFFMMLFVPTTYQPIKGVLLAVVLSLIGIGALVRGRLHLHKTILLWTLFMVVTGLLFIMTDVFNNAPSALRVGTVFVLWPLVYTVLITGINGKEILDNIFKVMVFSLIAISLYSIMYLLYVSGWLPPYLYIEIDMGQAVGFHEGFVEYRLYNISSLIFLVPFMLTMLFTWQKNSDVPISKYWIWLAFLLGFAVAILSGRRAVWLVLAISPLLIVAIKMFTARRIRFVIGTKLLGSVFVLLTMIVVLFFAGTNFAGLDITMISRELFAGFDFVGGGAGEAARVEQFFALIDGWQQNPLFGAGHGAAVAGSLRSVEMPWAFELSYLALLYHTGLLGFFIYSAGVIWTLWMGIKIIRSEHWLNKYMQPVLVGMVCFLVANATNPYLTKYDYIWVIFLPVAIINIWLLDKSKIKYFSGTS